MKLWTWILQLLLGKDDAEFVIGDALELYRRRAEQMGALRATLRVVSDVLASAWARLRRPPRKWRRPGDAGQSTTPVADLAHDAFRAFRLVFRDRAFSAVVIVTLALGIGASASVFGILNQMVLRPLPGTTDPGAAAYLRLLSRDQPDPWNGRGLATLDFDVLREGADFTDGITSVGNVVLQISVGDERPRSVWGNSIYGDFFEVLGVRPYAGRLLSGDDVAFGSDPLVAVISAELATELFGGPNAAVRRTVRANGETVQVVGVAPPGFQGTERRSEAHIWIPYPSIVPILSFPEGRLLDRSSVMHQDLIVRLKPGWTEVMAEERIRTQLAAIGESVPASAEYLADMDPTLYPGLTVPPGARPAIARSLRLLAVIVGMVLILACGNVANLLLFRNVARRGNAAVRRALGASAGRIMRGEMSYCLILATLGSIGGLVVASGISRLVQGGHLAGGGEIEAFTFDIRVLVFAVAMSLITAVMFGLVPAALAGRFDLRGALSAAGRGDTGRVAGLRTGMAGFQVALSLSLLISGVLLVRTVANLYAVDTGLDVDRVAILTLEFPGGFGIEDQRLTRERILDAVDGLPRAEAAAIGLHDPLGSARLFGRVARIGEDPMRTEMIPVSSDWFDVMGVSSRTGGPLGVTEDDWADGVVILTPALARRLFPDAGSALGQRIGVGFSRDLDDARVIGITEAMTRPSEPLQEREAFFVPFESSPWPSTTLIFRTADGGVSGLTAVRAVVEEVLPGAPVADAIPLSSRLDSVHAEARLFGRLVATLAGFSALLAGVGLYGVVAFTVAARRREFGVRIALGAGRRGIVALVVRHAATIVLFGAAAGLLGGFLMSRLLESRLYGLEATDPMSYALALGLIGFAATLACWHPTRRATGVDPVSALRAE